MVLPGNHIGGRKSSGVTAMALYPYACESRCDDEQYVVRPRDKSVASVDQRWDRRAESGRGEWEKVEETIRPRGWQW